MVIYFLQSNRIVVSHRDSHMGMVYTHFERSQRHIYEMKNANNQKISPLNGEFYSKCALDEWRVIFSFRVIAALAAVAGKSGVSLQLMICVEHAFFPIDKFFGAHERCKLRSTKCCEHDGALRMGRESERRKANGAHQMAAMNDGQ